ncbi:MAG: type IV pilus assembly protein PilM [bacterium]|nr:type IV pilus assembly protein PilM [bacterium]
MNLISKNAIGLDISDNSIEILELKKAFGKESVVSFARKKISAGLVERGRILQKQKLAQAIKETFAAAKPKKFTTKDVIFSLPENLSFIHIFRMPAVISEDNIAESVQYQAEETIPLSFDQVYHDHQVIFKDEDHQDVLYVAASDKIIEDYREVLDMAGLKLIVIENESSALGRALVKNPEEKYCIVDVGAKTTIITIYDNHGIRYSENIGIGGHTFTEKISKTLNINDEEAARLKRVSNVMDEKINNVLVDLQSITSEVVSEIKKSINFHQKQTGDMVDKIILCGGGSLMPGWPELLNKELNIEIIKGQPFAGLVYNKKQFENKAEILFSTVVGLAKRGIDNEKINKGRNLIATSKDEEIIEEKVKQDVKKKKIKIQSLKTTKNKRLLTMTIIFAVLIIIFSIVLYLNAGTDEPLIQFQEYDTPTGPVEY